MDFQAYDSFSKNGFASFALGHSHSLSSKSYMRGNLKSAKKEIEAYLQAYQKLDDTVGMRDALDDQATIAILQGNYEAAKEYNIGIESCNKKFADQQWVEIYNHIYNGRLAFIVNDLETARRRYTAALEGIKINQADIFAGATLMRLGFTLLYQGQADEARDSFQKGLATMEKVAQESDAAFYWYGLGEMERMTGNLPDALRYYQQALFQRKKFQRYIYIPDLLVGFAKLAFLQYDFTGTARWFGVADSLRRKFGSVMYPVYRPDYDRHVALLKSKMSAEELEAVWEEGARMDMHEAVALALQGYEDEK